MCFMYTNNNLWNDYRKKKKNITCRLFFLFSWCNTKKKSQIFTFLLMFNYMCIMYMYPNSCIVRLVGYITTTLRYTRIYYNVHFQQNIYTNTRIYTLQLAKRYLTCGNCSTANPIISDNILLGVIVDNFLSSITFIFTKENW